MLGMCYILCMTSSSVCYVASGAQGGLRKKNCLRKRVAFLIFRHMVFADGFLFPVKELGLLTNPGHWVRVLDVVGSYMYIVL
jgi:hypothetical protein